MDLDRLTYRDEVFTIATVESLPQKPINRQVMNPEFIPDMTSGESEAFQHAVGTLILEKAAPWIDAVDMAAYPNIDPKFFERKRAVDPLNDGRSVMLVIFKNGDLDAIQATLKISYRNLDNPNLPSDKLFPNQKNDSNTSTFDLIEKDPNKTTFERIVGPGMELGELAKKSKYDLLPVLWWTAKKKGATERVQPVAITSKGDKIWSGADRFELTCDASMVPKYEALGFKLDSTKPIAGDNFKMYTDQKGWKETIGENLSKRVGMRMIEKGVYVIHGAAFNLNKSLGQQDFNEIQKLFLPPDCHGVLPKITH